MFLEQEHFVLLGLYGKDFFMLNTIKNKSIHIQKNKGLVVVVLLVLSLLIPSIIAPQYTEAIKKNDVLKIVSKPHAQILIPTITITPAPTILVPTITLTPTSTVLSPTPTPTSAPTATPTPTPAGLKIQIGIDYAGQKTADSYTTTVNPGQSAWDAVSSAVGSNNLKYTDYGGDMGIFITGFNGIDAASNQYFEFRVNGVSSNTGVSNYKVNDGDKLDFVLMSF